MVLFYRNKSRLYFYLSLLFCFTTGVTIGWMVEFITWPGLVIMPCYAFLCAQLLRYGKIKLSSVFVVLMVLIGVFVGRVGIAFVFFFRDSSIIPPKGIFTPFYELFSPSLFPFAIIAIFVVVFYIYYKVSPQI